jgi:hypothetical protein
MILVNDDRPRIMDAKAERSRGLRFAVHAKYSA